MILKYYDYFQFISSKILTLLFKLYYIYVIDIYISEIELFL